MPKAGDTYEVDLEPSHLGWGNHRYTETRDIIYGEGYVPIPLGFARTHSVYNSNHSPEGMGTNLYFASSRDGYLQNVLLLAQGCKEAGDELAKQFSVQGDLKEIGRWYASQRATTANSVRVTWTSPTELQLEII
ncbi:hypothetical protein [Lacrimispora sp. 38-1]|uniref:hypothetical protein n=1 Tax=Lacrimispora sp. 38-1 TaxID=3125778 RepID=UPI003CF2A87A